MSNSSDGLRLFHAVAQECRIMAAEIAWLGGLVSGGTADAVSLQSFDFLSQHAQAQALLVAQLGMLHEGGSTREEFLALVDTIPLPVVRARLRQALDVTEDLPADDGDLVLWASG